MRVPNQAQCCSDYLIFPRCSACDWAELTARIQKACNTQDSTLAMSTLSARTGICRAQLVVPSTRAVAPRAPFLGRGQALPLRKVRHWPTSGACLMARWSVELLLGLSTCSLAAQPCSQSWTCHGVSPPAASHDNAIASLEAHVCTGFSG